MVQNTDWINHQNQQTQEFGETSEELHYLSYETAFGDDKRNVKSGNPRKK
jgi:hypothetical protein